MKNLFSILKTITYVGMGLVQSFALWAFLTKHWGWDGLLAGFASFMLGNAPLVGSICGLIGAVKVWGWSWWQAGLLFFWWPVLFVPFMLIKIGLLYKRKRQKEPRAQM